MVQSIWDLKTINMLNPCYEWGTWDTQVQNKERGYSDSGWEEQDCVKQIWFILM